MPNANVNVNAHANANANANANAKANANTSVISNFSIVVETLQGEGKCHPIQYNTAGQQVGVGVGLFGCVGV